jgi:transcription elongation factor Elf1
MKNFTIKCNVCGSNKVSLHHQDSNERAVLQCDNCNVTSEVDTFGDLYETGHEVVLYEG